VLIPRHSHCSWISNTRYYIVLNCFHITNQQGSTALERFDGSRHKSLEHRNTTQARALHFEDPVSFSNARVVSCSSLEHSADVLQRSVELTIYALKLTALAHLATNVESEAGDALRYRDFTGARRYFRRHRPSTLHHVLNEQQKHVIVRGSSTKLVLIYFENHWWVENIILSSDISITRRHYQ